MSTRADSERDGVRELYDASMRWDVAEVLRLLAAGVDPNAANENGRTALHAVCFDADPGEGDPGRERSDVTIIDALIRGGADVNARDSTGQTPLFDALRGDGPNRIAAQALIDRGALVDAVDHAGRTPLMESISWWQGKSVLLLIRASAQLRLRDRDGVTAEDLARMHAPKSGEDAGIRAMILGDAEASVGDEPPDLASMQSGADAVMSRREWACASLVLAMQAVGVGLLFWWGMPLAACLWAMMIPVNVWLLVGFRRVLGGPVVPERFWRVCGYLLRSALLFALLLFLHRIGWGWVVWLCTGAYLLSAWTMLRWLRAARPRARVIPGGAS